jgi:hypothetical protein
MRVFQIEDFRLAEGPTNFSLSGVEIWPSEIPTCLYSRHDKLKVRRTQGKS